MYLVGDVPEWQRELAAALREVEKSVDSLVLVPDAEKAKCYVSLAHDWYEMDCEEEGVKLLIKAENICPGYFKNQINDHINTSQEFAYLLNNLALHLRSLLIEEMKK